MGALFGPGDVASDEGNAAYDAAIANEILCVLDAMADDAASIGSEWMDGGSEGGSEGGGEGGEAGGEGGGEAGGGE